MLRAEKEKEVVEVRESKGRASEKEAQEVLWEEVIFMRRLE